MSGSKQHSMAAARILSGKPTKRYKRKMRRVDNGPIGRLDYWERLADRKPGIVLTPQSTLQTGTNEYLPDGYSFSDKPR